MEGVSLDLNARSCNNVIIPMRTCFQPARGIRRGQLNLFPATKVKEIPLPDGDRGVAITVGVMRKAALEGARDPQVRQLALRIVDGVPNRDSQGEINAVYNWVKTYIKFRGELDETVQSPQVTLKFGAGDCDDHAVLLAGLLGVIGYKVNFKTVAVGGDQDFSHVYAEVLDSRSGRWISLDTTVARATPGWEPPDVNRWKEWQGLGSTSMGRVTYRRRNRRMGDAASDIAAALNAAQPLTNAISAINVQNYNRNQPGASGSFTINTYPGGATVTGSSNVPTWMWVGGAVLAGALLLGLARARRSTR